MGRPPGSRVFSALDRRRAEFDHLYDGLGLALRPVAGRLGVSVKMLRLWMDGHGIPRRNRSQAQRGRSLRSHRTEDVVRLRLAERLTMKQISERLGYASKGAVHNILSSRGLAGPLSSLPTYERYLKDKKNNDRHARKITPRGGGE